MKKFNVRRSSSNRILTVKDVTRKLLVNVKNSSKFSSIKSDFNSSGNNWLGGKDIIDNVESSKCSIVASSLQKVEIVSFESFVSQFHVFIFLFWHYFMLDDTTCGKP